MKKKNKNKNKKKKKSNSNSFQKAIVRIEVVQTTQPLLPLSLSMNREDKGY